MKRLIKTCDEYGYKITAGIEGDGYVYDTLAEAKAEAEKYSEEIITIDLYSPKGKILELYEYSEQRGIWTRIH